MNKYKIIKMREKKRRESGQDGINYKSKQKLKKKLQELEEENNLLRLKYEMILNMLTQTTAEGEIQKTEIEKSKNKRK
ncbi:protein chibby homolog 1 isoform X2 [Leptinotarsa decemlineata]|uniref:protein chibby homolog 1 isoform X2 n=1 Tax=Leptinotarsa decemlineata TaxID=7539 RepID=UPI003D308E1B